MAKTRGRALLVPIIISALTFKQPEFTGATLTQHIFSFTTNTLTTCFVFLTNLERKLCCVRLFSVAEIKDVHPLPDVQITSVFNMMCYLTLAFTRIPQSYLYDVR